MCDAFSVQSLVPDPKAPASSAPPAAPAPSPWPRCCLLKGAKVSTAAVALPRSHPATVLCQGMAQRAGSAPRWAAPSREPLCYLSPPPPLGFPMGMFQFAGTTEKMASYHSQTGDEGAGVYLAPPKCWVTFQPWGNVGYSGMHPMGQVTVSGVHGINAIRDRDPASQCLREGP